MPVISNFLTHLRRKNNRLITEDGKFKFSVRHPPQNPAYGRPLNDVLFRFWPAAEESKNRIMKLDEIIRENNLAIYTHFLYDYAPVICHYLNRTDLEHYNTHAMVQVGDCGLNCWHCYVEWEVAFQNENLRAYSAQEVFDLFINEYQKSQQYSDVDPNKVINVLRISDGEPFLLPQFIIEILELLKDRNDDNLFIWTETNLTPFINDGNGVWINQIMEDALDKLKEYKDSFCLHPCIHGISDNLLLEVCGGLKKIIKAGRDESVDFNFLSYLLEGLKTLIDSEINIYPTFGCSVNSVEDVGSFFDRLVKIHENLPLRFALIEYKFYYDFIRNRMTSINRRDYEKIYNQVFVIDEWDRLIRDEYDNIDGYGRVPRYNVTLRR